MSRFEKDFGCFQNNQENKIKMDPDKKYFAYKTLGELIQRTPLKLGTSQTEEQGSSFSCLLFVTW